MSDQPLISVLMTAYNEERFLPRALDSVLAQTYPYFEIIVVNDGSTDGTAAILDRYSASDARIRTVHQPKTGRSASLNAAFALIQGEYIAIMDSDDVSLPRRLEMELAYLQAHPVLGMVGSFYEQINTQGERIKTVDRIPTEPDAVADLLSRDNPICHGTVLIRRAVMAQAGVYREAFPAALDYDLYLRVLDHAAIGLIPEVLYQYRVHGSSISSRRLLQLQMKRLAQVLQAERKESGQDSLQRLSGNLDEQRAYVEGFLKRDGEANRRQYARQLFEMGRKYYRLGEADAAFRLFQAAFKLDPMRLRNLRYLGKAYLKSL